jgi:hypothetical protein
MGLPTSCAAPDFLPARAGACDPAGAQFESHSVQGWSPPRAPARLRLRRTPVAVAWGEATMLYRCLETAVRCFADAVLHAAGFPPLLCGVGAAAAMCNRGEQRDIHCRVPTCNISVACAPQTALGVVLAAMCVTHAATPSAQQGMQLKVPSKKVSFSAIFTSAQIPT